MPLTKHVIKIDDKNYYYWQSNRRHQDTVVLLHGFPGNHRSLADFSSCFSNYCVIIPDLPACGESELLSNKHTLDNYTSWLNKFFIQLNLNQPIVIGHSFGSRLALSLGNLEPQKISRLVLITPVTKVDSWIGQLGSFEYQIANSLPPKLQKFWLTNDLSKSLTNFVLYKTSNDKLRKKLITLASQEIEHVSPKASIELFTDFKKSNILLTARNIKIKTLIIAGDKDEIAPIKSVQELAKILPKAKFKIIKGSGHMAPLEQPQATARLITDWLNS